MDDKLGGQDRPVLLAAGGTGGHLFPAFALAEELGRRDIEVELVTDERGDRYGSEFPAREIHQIPSATLPDKSPINVARTAWTLSRGIGKAVELMGRVKPSVVVGFGGYPTFPPLLAARLRGIPCAIHEQNAVLGRANRMLAGRVDKIAMSFVKTKFLDKAFQDKAVCTGNPVRQVVLDQAQRPYWSPLEGEPVRLVVFGGSQGARFFSDMIPEAVRLLPEGLRSRLQIVQQAREEDVKRVRASYTQSGVGHEVESFFRDLPQIMAGAQLVIGRAGASTVAELTVIGRPAVLVPLPHSLDNDQLENATRLAESGGAWCIEQKDLTPESLAEGLEQLFGDPAELSKAAAAAKAQGRPDAVSALADLVVGLTRKG